MHRRIAIAMRMLISGDRQPQLSLCQAPSALQQCAMAVLQCWCDRAAVLVMGGT